MPRIGTTTAEALAGAVAIAWAFLTPFLRSRRRRWGARDAEVTGPLAGDELVPAPSWTATHAIAIDAPPEKVWPWIAQIGQGRGGFYSYEKLENLVGCAITNASGVLEAHQHIAVGDPIRLHAEAPPMHVAVAEAPEALVLFGNPAEAMEGASVSSTWAFLLLPQPDGTTRLLSRTRYHHGDDRLSRLMGGPLVLEPIAFVMERKMLHVIKALVESAAQHARST